MHVYNYDGDIYCVTCGEKLCDDIVPPGGYDPDDESSYDSSEYPKGPYPDGGGEADTPKHCADCGEFLGNPLTLEGYAYVMGIHADGKNSGVSSETVQGWCDFYWIGMLCDDEPREGVDDEELDKLRKHPDYDPSFDLGDDLDNTEDMDDEELDSCKEEFDLNEHWDHLSDLLDDDKAF